MKTMCVLFLFLFYGELFAQGNTVDPCNIYDVVIVLDQSGSVSDDFSLACREVASFLNALSIETHAVNAAFVTFNSKPYIIHTLSGDKVSLVNSAVVMSEDKASGTTDILSALHVVYDLFLEGSRWGSLEVPKICIVITDGYPTESVDTILRLQGNEFAYPSLAYVKFMKDSDITFYTISMGSEYDYSRHYLERLANSPNHFFFSQYTNLAQTLSRINLCQ